MSAFISAVPGFPGVPSHQGPLFLCTLMPALEGDTVYSLGWMWKAQSEPLRGPKDSSGDDRERASLCVDARSPLLACEVEEPVG